MYKDLASYIRQRTKDMGLSLHALSERLGYSTSYINNLVAGQFRPTQKKCREIAAAFGDDPAIILKLAGYYQPPEDGGVSEEMLAIIRGLPKAERSELEKFLKYLVWRKDQ